MEVSQRRNGQNRCQLIKGDLGGDGKVKMAYGEGDAAFPEGRRLRQGGEGTTEFWTNDMPQDDTWEPNRHHSHMLPLFRSHLTRDTAAMFPLFKNPVASTEHGCRDPFACCVTHRECRGRRKKRGFGVAKIIQCVQ